MSARKMRRQREIAERKRVRSAVLKVAREQGCVCTPTVEITTIHARVNGATIRHDDWCPLLGSYSDRANPDVPTGPLVVIPDAWEPT